MAKRPVFIPWDQPPYMYTVDVEFAWHGGFAVSQKQKNIADMHHALTFRYPERRPLEISSKSMEPLGVKLSAFSLMTYVPSLGKRIPVECVFQGGKVFAQGGPYTDMYGMTARDAKRDPRLRESGPLTAFAFEGKRMPLRPATAFYNWLYIRALMENEELAKALEAYDAFTDIEFNPGKSLNCQAEAAAMYIGLSRAGLLDRCRDFDSFVGLYGR